ncbi:MAG: sensor histidine kinase [Candidatus Sericytochromatia bacterium]
MTHNLRGPLANAISLLRLYQQEPTAAERENYLGLLETTLRQAITQLEELGAQVQIPPAEDSSKLADSLARVCQALAYEIQQTRACFQSDFAVASVPCRALQLDSLLYNLLSNSLKYHVPGRAPDIQLRSWQENQQVFLEVQDNGLGLDCLEHAQQLFQPYQTFHIHPQAQGLGLYLTRLQLSEIDAQIELVAGQLNGGCCFRVTFPGKTLPPQAGV